MSEVFSASGQVFTAECAEDGGKYAIKCMDLKLQPKKELLLTELLVMRQYKHPNLVNYVEVYTTFSWLFLLEIGWECLSCKLLENA